MYLHLQNFCCWEDKAFHFPEEGSILISAPSGSGKTSIVRAIMFALFGTGDKIIMHGKRSCSVELKLKDLHILRKKGPGRLVVNQTYEDQAAQYMIHKYFDNELFYLQQGGRNSFITLSAMDKLVYLEKIIFQQIPIQEIKTNLKNATKEVENQLLVKKSETNTIDTFLSEIHIPDELLNRSFSDEKFESLKQCYSQTQIRLEKSRTCRIRADAIQSQISQFNTLIQTLQETEYQRLQEKLEYTQKLEKLKDTKEEIHLYNKYALRLEKQQKLDVIQNELIEKQALYTTIVKNERDMIEQKIYELESEMEKYQTTEEYQTEIRRLEKIQQKQTQLNSVQSELDSLVLPASLSSFTIQELSQNLMSIEDQLRKFSRILQEIDTSYECPNCNSILKLQNHTLIENPIEMDRTDCIQKITYLQEQKRQYTDWHSQLQEFYKKQDYLSLKIKNLQSEIDYTIPKQSVDVLKQELIELTSKNRVLDRYYDELDAIVEKYDSLKKQIDSLEDRSSKLKGELLDMIQVPDTLNLTSVQTLITEYQYQQQMRVKYQSLLEKTNHHLEVSEQNRLKHQSLKEQKEEEYKQIFVEDEDELGEQLKILKQSIEFESELQRYQTSKELLTKYMLQKSENTIEIKELENQLVNYMRLKEKIAESESIALTNLIQTVNTNVQLYLDAFFEKEPIQVTLSAFKMVKDTKKTQLNLVVHYKGNQIELSNLSGGEYDRVVLAFTLTFAELTHSPLLLLDECVSSLDQENAENVFDCIKSHCKNKLIVLIAHQIVTGMFDEIIQLD